VALRSTSLFPKEYDLHISCRVPLFFVANRKIDNVLSAGRSYGLARLLRQASQQEARTAQLCALLPEDLAFKCLVANLRDHVLTVHTYNAVWATRFRFLIPKLLPKLNQLADFSAVREIRVRVVPQAGLPDEPVFERPAPPDAKSLESLARTVDYPELKAAILRLARHADT
jgi:hypothetical protein